MNEKYILMYSNAFNNLEYIVWLQIEPKMRRTMPNNAEQVSSRRPIDHINE
jgi:hypothetical protein